MNTIKYKAFLKCIELNSLTKAAEELGYTQPGITHMLNSLESEIGFPLLNRTKDAIEPTENGRKFIYYFEQILKNQDAIDETISSINGVLTGTIRIGAFNSMLIHYIPSIVNGFIHEYPDIEIRLQELPYRDIVDKLQKGSIDIAFMNSDIPKGFAFIPMLEDSIGVIMNKNHPLTRKNKLFIHDLNDVEFISSPEGWNDNIEIVKKKSFFSPNTKHYIASDIAAINMVADGIGVYIISGMQTSLLPETVVFREFEEKPSRTLGICFRNTSHASPALRAFINIVKR